MTVDIDHSCEPFVASARLVQCTPVSTSIALFCTFTETPGAFTPFTEDRKKTLLPRHFLWYTSPAGRSGVKVVGLSDNTCAHVAFFSHPPIVKYERSRQTSATPRWPLRWRRPPTWRKRWRCSSQPEAHRRPDWPSRRWRSSSPR